MTVILKYDFYQELNDFPSFTFFKWIWHKKSICYCDQIMLFTFQ